MADQLPLIDITIYTDRLRIAGQVALPYRRVIDVLNSDDREYISIERATVAPLVMPTQVTGPNPNATLMHRLRVILAGLTEAQAAPLPDDTTASRVTRTPCLGFVGAFVFQATVGLLPGQRILDLMETQRAHFGQFNTATVYLIDRPDLPPQQHAGLVVSLPALDALYVL